MSKPVNIDHVFKNGMGDYQEPFDENAWKKMSEKLDTKAPVGASWFTKRIFNSIFILSIIAIIITLSAIVLHTDSKKNTTNTYQVSTQTASNTESTVDPPKNNISIAKPSLPAQQKAIVHTKSNPGKTNVDIEPETDNEYEPDESLMNNNTFYLSALLSYAGYNMIPPVNYHPRYKGRSAIRRKTSGHYDCAHVGFHFEYVNPVNTYASLGQRPGYGFDIEAYTPNLNRRLPFGLFLGGTFAMAWMGESNRTDVVLNTVNSDPGITYLQNKKFNFDMNLKVEFGKNDLKFYAFATAGWRQVAVDHITDSKNYLRDYSASSDYVSRKNMMEWGGGAGLRYHFRPGISFDFRITYIDADYSELVDVRTSTYNGFNATYALTTNFVQPQVISLKLGMLFCFHDIAEHFDRDDMGYGMHSSSHSTYHIGVGGGGGSRPKVPVTARPSTPKK